MDVQKKAARPGRKQRMASLVCRIVSLALFLLILAVYVPLTVPRYLGCEILEIVSGSMAPTIPTGSIVYIASAAPEDIMPGDVIAYDANEEMPIVHRVTENHVVDGEFITKGDANTDVDLAPVHYEQFIGKVTFHLSVLGRLADWAVTLVGKLYAAGFLLAAVLFQVLAGRFSELSRDAAAPTKE